MGGEANQNNTHCEDKAEVEHHHAIHRLDYRQTVRQFGEKNTAFIAVSYTHLTLPTSDLV